MSRDRMNVLFVPVDDLRCQLNCYGMSHVITPNIDKLAASGTAFFNAHCQQAVCAPSRASVLTGARPDTTRIYDLKTPVRSVMPDVLTLPQHFKINGYEAVSVGKVYHHGDDDLEGWSIPPYKAKGDWKGRGYVTDEAIATIAAMDVEQQKMGSARRGLGPAFEAADVPDNGYHDGANTDRAIEELRRLAKGDKPLFLAYGLSKPHLPFNAPRKYWDMYDPGTLPLAENPFEPEGATAYSLTNFGELRGYFGMPKEGPVPDDIARRLVHGYCACVSYIDAQLGRVLDELDALDVRENTVVVLWGDHGWKLGEHASWCKHTNFEIDTRAPLLVSAPGQKTTGAGCERLVEFVDMYPTLSALCGLPTPDHLEGQSLAPLLDDPTQSWTDAAFSQYPRGGGIMGYTVRTPEWRYVEWIHRETGDVRARELYDHRADDFENVNLAGREEHASVVARLSSLLEKKRSK